MCCRLDEKLRQVAMWGWSPPPASRPSARMEEDEEDETPRNRRSRDHRKASLDSLVNAVTNWLTEATVLLLTILLLAVVVSARESPSDQQEQQIDPSSPAGCSLITTQPTVHLPQESVQFVRLNLSHPVFSVRPALVQGVTYTGESEALFLQSLFHLNYLCFPNWLL